MNDLLVAVFKKYYAGMTQAKIGELADIQEAAISQIWNSKRGLTITSFGKLCNGLGVKGSAIWLEAESL